MSLSEAREKAFMNRKIACSGGDPRAERHKVRDMPTVAEAAARVLEQKRPGWRSGKHPNDWISSLRADAFPELGHRPVGEITTAYILAVPTPIWHGKHVTARRVRQRIGAVMKWRWRWDFGRTTPPATCSIRRLTGSGLSSNT